LNTDDETKLEYALRGKAWKVYWFLLKTGKSMSVREVQRALHFSSPSVANHHLEQLRGLGGVGLGLKFNAKKGKKKGILAYQGMHYGVNVCGWREELEGWHHISFHLGNHFPYVILYLFC